MINNVVLGVIVCLENKAVMAELEKKYVVTIKKLDKYNKYVSSPEFKNKIDSNAVNDINFDSCVSFTIKHLGSEKFRTFCQKDNICLIAFYPKTSKENLHKFDKFTKNNDPKDDQLMLLTKTILKHSIEDDTLTVYINPVIPYRDRVLDQKDKLISYYAKDNTNVTNLEVKFIHKDVVLDDLSVCFLEMGYNIK